MKNAIFYFKILSLLMIFYSCEPWDLARILPPQIEDGVGELAILTPNFYFKYHVDTFNKEFKDTIILKNIGTANLTIKNIESEHSDVYSAEWNGANLVIAPDSILKIPITFAANEYADYIGYFYLTTDINQEKDTIPITGEIYCLYNEGWGNSSPGSPESVPYNVWYGCGFNGISTYTNTGCGAYLGKIKAKITSFERGEGLMTIQWDYCNFITYPDLTNLSIRAIKAEHGDQQVYDESGLDLSNKSIQLSYTFSDLIDESYIILLFSDEKNGIIKRYKVTIYDLRI